MNKVVVFFKTVSSKILLIICVCLGLLAKLIESKLPDLAMAFQLITFGLLLFAIKKFLNSRAK